VQTALEHGVNCFDTAESYGTEDIIGAALQHVKREDYVLCSKFHGGADGAAQTLSQVEDSLDRSLTRLHTDYIDVYMLHAVGAIRYDAIAVPVVPSLLKMKEKGKIRAIGITECFGVDRSHKMLRRALSDDWYDVIMVGYNLINPSAATEVFKTAKDNSVGVLGMFAVRRALRNTSAFSTYVEEKISEGDLEPSARELVRIVQELVACGYCDCLCDLAYRYCFNQKGIDCVLSGTGSIRHLLENIASVEKPALPSSLISRIEEITQGWNHLSAQ
jgi:aryl-alcohol dehydrogenase-like predicted oxidoreductase